MRTLSARHCTVLMATAELLSLPSRNPDLSAHMPKSARPDCGAGCPEFT